MAGMAAARAAAGGAVVKVAVRAVVSELLTCSACVRPSIVWSSMLQPVRLSSVHTLFDESAAPS